MSTMQIEDLGVIYEQDETAWLEHQVRLIREGQRDALDFENLSEFLDAMAKRDRREVESRLAILLAHLLKWSFQPEKRSAGWRGTIEVQRHELHLLLQSATLRNHAEAELGSAYVAALRQAAAETGIGAKLFPQKCFYTVQQLLEIELPPENAD